MQFKPYKTHDEIHTMDEHWLRDFFQVAYVTDINLQDINECLSDYIRYLDNPNQLEFNWKQGVGQ
tara:strand:+ start:85 stop:279 length:195 start_codon:yes stop_codon:yes gene_type:complete